MSGFVLPKFTALKDRAVAFCEDVKREGCGSFYVVWRRSRDYGLCPSTIHDRYDKMAYAGGCGYCKESTVLAETLQYLGATPEQQRAISLKAGAGVRPVQAALEEQGWLLNEEGAGDAKVWRVHKLIPYVRSQEVRSMILRHSVPNRQEMFINWMADMRGIALHCGFDFDEIVNLSRDLFMVERMANDRPTI